MDEPAGQWQRARAEGMVSRTSGERRLVPVTTGPWRQGFPAVWSHEMRDRSQV